MSTRTAEEILSQPDVWERAAPLTSHAIEVLQRPGESMLLIGCGTSAFVAHVIAHQRETAGHGTTDWAYASEMPARRTYDSVVAISRSGTTTEVLDAVRTLSPHTTLRSICGVGDSPLAELSDTTLLLDFADEQSVVQTRFPTTVLTLAARAFGHDVDALIHRCHQLFGERLPVDGAEFEHFVFLARSAHLGLAHEAALKIRETAQAWSESHPAMDYRHGPIAVAGPHTLVWIFGEPPPGLVDDLRRIRATVVTSQLDPVLQLVQAQRLALDVALHKELNPDLPRHLTRSVVLTP